MTINSSRLFRFALPFKRTVFFKQVETEQREGLLLQLIADDQTTAWGEISPLPVFSTESLDDALAQTRSVLPKLYGCNLIDALPTLDGAFDEWLGDFNLFPSVRHGIETAVLALMANGADISIARLLAESPPTTFHVNGLISGEASSAAEQARQMQRDGFRAVKLKVGRHSIAEDIDRTKDVFHELDSRCVLRLNANSAWSIDQAREFLDGIQDCQIEYLEDPVKSLDELKQLLFAGSAALAVDELLGDLEPPDLVQLRDLAAIVIKPMIIGGFERTAQFARIAREHQIKVVLSSAFDSPLGIAALGPLVTACGTPGVPVGLETVNWFADGFLDEPVAITGGMMRVEQLARAAGSIDESRLTEIPCAG